jgi:hypothetical protein
MTSEHPTQPDLHEAPLDIPPAPPYVHQWALRDACGDVIACGTDDGKSAECHMLDHDAMDRFVAGLVTVGTRAPLTAIATSDKDLAKAA